MSFHRFIKHELKELLSGSLFGRASRALGIKEQLELCGFVAQEQSEHRRAVGEVSVECGAGGTFHPWVAGCSVVGQGGWWGV